MRERSGAPLARCCDDVLALLEASLSDLPARVAAAALARVLQRHDATVRARELVAGLGLAAANAAFAQFPALARPGG